MIKYFRYDPVSRDAFGRIAQKKIKKKIKRVI